MFLSVEWSKYEEEDDILFLKLDDDSVKTFGVSWIKDIEEENK